MRTPPHPRPGRRTSAPSPSGPLPSQGELAVFAGNLPLSGSADGKGDAARFFNPWGVVVDRRGNAFVADQGNHTIRKITPAGRVTTLAGKAGQAGARDGQGSAARFDCPSFLALDAKDHLFVSDYNNNAIRRITPGGRVSTFTGQLGAAPGAADHTHPQDPPALFNNPTDLGFDGQGNLFVADNDNNTIRMVTPDGLVSTVAGAAGPAGSADSPQGPGSDARFNNPLGLAVDVDGILWVADTNNHTIRKIIPGSGVVTTLAGSAGHSGYADGQGGAAAFNCPGGLAVDRRRQLYVGDNINNAIRMITPIGVVSTYAGRGEVAGCEDGGPGVATFNGPEGVAVDTAGDLFVVDLGNNTIRKVTRGRKVSTLAGKAGGIGSTDGTATTAAFNHPGGVAMDQDGNLYVADTNNFTIRLITPGGVVSTLAGKAGAKGFADGQGETARFGEIYFLAVDGHKNVYVSDKDNHVIRKVTPEGVVTTVAGTPGAKGDVDGDFKTARLNHPTGLAVDAAGEHLYMADHDSNTIRHIVPGGPVNTLSFSGGSESRSGDVAGIFNAPMGLILDPSGTLYVADASSFTIRTVTPGASGWTVGTLAGQTGTPGNQDGTGISAQFEEPYEMALDGARNLVVVDSAGGTIRKVTPSGVVTTIVGAPNTPDTVGLTSLNQLALQGVAVAPAGDTVYLAVNNAILVARLSIEHPGG